MMSHRSDQHSLFAADTQYLEFVGPDSFYGSLARQSRELFPDQEFAELCCPDFGRPSVPPSMLAIALLLQAHDRVSDQEPTERGCRTRNGTAKDRMPSVHDPEQRHGHKSHGRPFTGHKAAVAADVDSQLITEVEVIAPTVKPHSGRTISKDDFEIDVARGRVRCPEGDETRHCTWTWVRPGRDQPKAKVKRFGFDKEVCRACPRYAECVTDKRRRGRFITLHP